MSIAPIAAAIIVTTEALPVIATQPTDSPYVVLGQPPKIAPAIEPTPSPRSVPVSYTHLDVYKRQ